MIFAPRERLAIPTHRLDARIVVKCRAVKIDSFARHFTQGSGAVATEENAPGLTITRLGLGEGTASQ